jgi:hypothetical protein
MAAEAMPTPVGAEQGRCRPSVAHGKQAATEGFPCTDPHDGPVHAMQSIAPHRFAESGTGTYTSKPAMNTIAMKHWNKSPSFSRHYLNAGAPFFVSPATTAVCLLVFGVLHTVATMSAQRVAVDIMLGVNALFYVAAALLAKFAWHTREPVHCFRLARYANHLSILGLLMTIAGTCCLMLVVAISA